MNLYSLLGQMDNKPYKSAATTGLLDITVRISVTILSFIRCNKDYIIILPSH